MVKDFVFAGTVTLQSVAFTGRIKHIRVFADMTSEFIGAQEEKFSFRAYLPGTSCMKRRAGIGGKDCHSGVSKKFFHENMDAEKTVITRPSSGDDRYCSGVECRVGTDDPVKDISCPLSGYQNTCRTIRRQGRSFRRRFHRSCKCIFHLQCRKNKCQIPSRSHQS